VARTGRRKRGGTTFAFRLTNGGSIATKIQRVRGKRIARLGALPAVKPRTGGVRIAFSGRVGRKWLVPGRYRALLRASNASGRSRWTGVRFTVVR